MSLGAPGVNAYQSGEQYHLSWVTEPSLLALKHAVACFLLLHHHCGHSHDVTGTMSCCHEPQTQLGTMPWTVRWCSTHGIAVLIAQKVRFAGAIADNGALLHPMPDIDWLALDIPFSSGAISVRFRQLMNKLPFSQRTTFTGIACRCRVPALSTCRSRMQGLLRR